MSFRGIHDEEGFPQELLVQFLDQLPWNSLVSDAYGDGTWCPITPYGATKGETLSASDLMYGNQLSYGSFHAEHSLPPSALPRRLNRGAPLSVSPCSWKTWGWRYLASCQL